MLLPWVSQEAANTHTQAGEWKMEGEVKDLLQLFNKLFKQVSN